MLRNSEDNRAMKAVLLKCIEWRAKGHYLAACLALLLITLGETRVFDRLLYANQAECAFVSLSVDGVLRGRPVYKGWQNRLLAPALIKALDSVTANRVESLKVLSHLALLCSNLLLFAIVRQRGGSLMCACVAVAAFGFCRLLLVYKLEYPWDGVDTLIFLAFGYWSSTGRSILWFGPLLLVGILNHEAILYVPFWYLLSPFDRAESPRGFAGGVASAAPVIAVTVLMVSSILGLREYFYLGQPYVRAQVFEDATPLISNPIHVLHNLGQLLWANWSTERAFISVVELFTLGLLAV